MIDEQRGVFLKQRTNLLFQFSFKQKHSTTVNNLKKQHKICSTQQQILRTTKLALFKKKTIKNQNEKTMFELKNFVAVDWRSGKDRCYFFFKDTNTYSKYNNSEDRVTPGHPKEITQNNWGDFHEHAKNLRFGFSADRIVGSNRFEWDADILWLFYYDKQTPMVCEYDQDKDKPVSFTPVSKSIWSMLLPYFDNIIAGTFWERPLRATGKTIFRFILNNGKYLHLDWHSKKVIIDDINDTTWPGLGPYATYADDQFITAVQIDGDFLVSDSYLYIFMTGNLYLKYNISKTRLEGGGVRNVGDHWSGLLDA